MSVVPVIACLVSVTAIVAALVAIAAERTNRAIESEITAFKVAAAKQAIRDQAELERGQ